MGLGLLVGLFAGLVVGLGDGAEDAHSACGADECSGFVSVDLLEFLEVGEGVLVWLVFEAERVEDLACDHGVGCG